MTTGPSIAHVIVPMPDECLRANAVAFGRSYAAAFRRFAERINVEEAEQLRQALEQARLTGGRR